MFSLKDIKVGQFYKNKSSGNVYIVTAIGEEKVLIKRISKTLSTLFGERTFDTRVETYKSDNEVSFTIENFIKQWEPMVLPREVWINIFKIPSNGKIYIQGGYDTKKEADDVTSIFIQGTTKWLERSFCKKIEIPEV